MPTTTTSRKARLEKDELESLISDIEDLPQFATKELVSAMQEAVYYVEGEVKQRTPVGAAGRGLYSRFLAQTITSEVRQEGDNAIGVVGTDVDYARYVEFGTRPHWPPARPIEEWVFYSHKFDAAIAAGARIKSLTYLVRRKIANKGTPAVKMFENGLAVSQDAIKDIYNRAVDKICSRFAQGDI